MTLPYEITEGSSVINNVKILSINPNPEEHADPLKEIMENCEITIYSSTEAYKLNELKLFNKEESYEEIGATKHIWVCEICNLVNFSSNKLNCHLQTHSIKELCQVIILLTKPKFISITPTKVKVDSDIVNETEPSAEPSTINEIKSEPNFCEEETPTNTKVSKKKNNKSSEKSKAPHICNICKKVFTIRGNLSKHMILHQEKKPFGCEICNKGFNAKRNKEQHYIQHHTTLRPFVCDICSKGFSTKRILKDHLSFHNMNNEYKCSNCFKSFTHIKCLKQHLARHNKKRKSFICHICLKTFLVKEEFLNHLKNDHSMKL